MHHAPTRKPATAFLGSLAELVYRLGWDDTPIVVPAAEVQDIDLFIHATNHLVQAIPYLQRRAKTGWPPGSVGDLGARIGTDVRELMIIGYTDRQIRGVLRGEYTLDELYKRRPKSKRMTLRGQKS